MKYKELIENVFLFTLIPLLLIVAGLLYARPNIKTTSIVIDKNIAYVIKDDDFTYDDFVNTPTNKLYKKIKEKAIRKYLQEGKTYTIKSYIGKNDEYEAVLIDVVTGEKHVDINDKKQ